MWTRWGSRTWATRPPPAAAAHALEAAQSAQEVDDQSRARRCLHDLSRTLRSARNAKQLTTMWAILSRNAPVVTDRGFLRTLGGTTKNVDESGVETRDEVVIAADSLALRMVPVQEMLEMVKQGGRHHVVERAPPFVTSPGFLNAVRDDQESETAVTPTPTSTAFEMHVADDCVLLVSENFVARKILWALYRLGEHQALAQFLETFESERSHLRPSDNDDSETTALTTLGNHIDALYIASLGQLRANAKILERFEHHDSDLSRYIVNRDAFRSLLSACMMERDGGLARSIIDQALDGLTLSTFNVRPFTFAIHANLRGEPKTLEGLENAMHIYRRMFHDAGYILAPRDWSMMFNSCIYLTQHELAMEIFADYRAHGIAPFQTRFQQALRTACRYEMYDTAIEMARAWVRLEKERGATNDQRMREDEAECLNKILWEMLKTRPTLAQIEQVLALMETRRVNAGALVIRRIVSHFFKDGEDEYPGAVVKRFFDMWASCPSVIQRTSFVLHLVIEECEAKRWSEQCERVIEYALEENIELPIASTVKLMDRYASRGEFDEAIRLGELVLHPRLEKAEAAAKKPKSKQRSAQADAHTRIPDQFFESLLTCYLFRERFAEVVRIDDAFELDLRRGEWNPKLATLIRDARDMVW